MNDQTITTVATHYIKSEKKQEFLQWLERIRAETSKFEGYIDSTLIMPIEGHSDEHVSIFRFNNYENLKHWLKSDIQNQMAEEVSAISYKKVKVAPYKSLEFWFNGTKAPSRLKMSLITYLGLLPLVITIRPIVEYFLDWHYLILTSISTAIGVLCMSYFVMPFLNRLLLAKKN